MYFGYYDYFSTPEPATSVNYLIIAAAAGGVVGLIMYFTLFKKSNEKKLKGKSSKIYNFMNLNKFYLEDIIRLLNILTFFVLTAEGIALLISGEWEKGLLILVGLNLAARIVYELFMMFIIQIRRTISIDKKLEKIEKFYEDEYEDFDDGECGQCEGCYDSSCEGCTVAQNQGEEIKHYEGPEGANSFSVDVTPGDEKKENEPHIIEL